MCTMTVFAGIVFKCLLTNPPVNAPDVTHKAIYRDGTLEFASISEPVVDRLDYPSIGKFKIIESTYVDFYSKKGEKLRGKLYSRTIETYDY